jgi:hypothetical protein
VRDATGVLGAAPICGVVLLAAAAALAAAQRTDPPPLAVTFSAPVQDEADVHLDAVIRIQFSRHVDERSLSGRVMVAYSAAESAERGEAQPPALPFTLNYDAATRAITITPQQRLERFRGVHVDLSEGIVGTDGATLEPWRLRFSTGGSEQR